MAKQKNRASRKSERERASRAGDRGLPQAKSSANTAARRGAQAGSSARRLSKASNSAGKGTLARIALGIVVALVVVFLISQSRKDDMLEAQELPTQAKSLPDPKPPSAEPKIKFPEASQSADESVDTEVSPH